MRSPTTSVVKSRFTAGPTPEAPSPFSSPWLQTPPARTEATLFSLYLRYSLRFSGFEGRICVGQHGVRRFSPLPTDRAAPLCEVSALQHVSTRPVGCLSAFQ